MLDGKYILLGVSSSIACYKSLELVRLFRKAGAEVRVTMTRNATKMITPLQFEALSENPVYVDVFSRNNPWEVEHVVAADWGDALVVAPATANVIAKMACGIGDDALTTLCLAFPGPVFVAPAMHTEMWRHPATRENTMRLKERGVRIIDPESGDLASGDRGVGRLASPETIFEAVRDYFLPHPVLAGKRVLVTAGPTREALDPVRFLSNRSSGKMGYALAEEAARRGARTILLSGPAALPDPAGVETIRVDTAEEMSRETGDRAGDTDIFIFAAAVSDYRPESASTGKIKKGEGEMTLRLVPNPDIARLTGENSRPDQILVGFAAETENLREAAAEKLRSKNLDLIIANDVSRRDVGMESEENQVMVMSRSGIIEETGILSKKALAERIWNIIEQIPVQKRGEDKNDS